MTRERRDDQFLKRAISALEEIDALLNDIDFAFLDVSNAGRLVQEPYELARQKMESVGRLIENYGADRPMTPAPPARSVSEEIMREIEAARDYARIADQYAFPQTATLATWFKRLASIEAESIASS